MKGSDLHVKKIVLPCFSRVFFPSCVVFEPIYGHSVSFRENGLLSEVYIEGANWFLQNSEMAINRLNRLRDHTGGKNTQLK